MYGSTSGIARKAAWEISPLLRNQYDMFKGKAFSEHAERKRKNSRTMWAIHKYGEGRTYNYVLVDYRNGNEILKTSSMTVNDAVSKNDVLSGTGMAWARRDNETV